MPLPTPTQKTGERMLSLWHSSHAPPLACGRRPGLRGVDTGWADAKEKLAIPASFPSHPADLVDFLAGVTDAQPSEAAAEQLEEDGGAGSATPIMSLVQVMLSGLEVQLSLHGGSSQPESGVLSFF